MIRSLIKTGKPCLVEKPVFIEKSFDEIDFLEYKKIRVAYNRRFYATIQSSESIYYEKFPCFMQVRAPGNNRFISMKNMIQFY